MEIYTSKRTVEKPKLAEDRKSRRTEVAYAKLANDLRRQIQNGKLAPGHMIPSLRRISEQHSVAIGTAQQAVRELVTEGLLRSEDGRGTFVADGDAVRRSIVSATSAAASSVKAATIGVITPIICGDIDTRTSRVGVELVIGSFERYASAHNATTRFFGFNDGKGKMVDVVEATKQAIAAGCDGLIAVNHFSQAQCEEVTRLAEAASVKVVFAASSSEFPRRPSTMFVYYANEDAGEQAAEHLLSRGVRDLVFFGPEVVDWARARLNGALKAATGYPGAVLSAFLGDRQIAAQQEDLVAKKVNIVGDMVPPSYNAAKPIVAAGLRGRGVIAANDSIAHGFMLAAEEQGYVAGRDYAIIGFDDHPNAMLWNLTSMQPPWHAIGQEAGRLLIESLGGELSSAPTVCLRSHVVARCSSLVDSK